MGASKQNGFTTYVHGWRMSGVIEGEPYIGDDIYAVGRNTQRTIECQVSRNPGTNTSGGSISSSLGGVGRCFVSAIHLDGVDGVEKQKNYSQCLPSQDHDGNHRSGRNDGMLPRNIVCCEPG